ncbi:MAG TPA: cytochrome C oxidase subunit IV family protein [Verrucomicrobiae bacterium]|jgi:cytochrome c oxidase subunit 4
MNLQRPTQKKFTLTWLALVIFHFTILGSAYLNLGIFNTLIIAALAIVQMILIILFFMEVRWSAKLIWIFAAAGFFWLCILFTLTASDYLTRQWH